MAATTKDGGEESKVRGRESSHSVVTGSQVRDNDNADQRWGSGPGE